MKVEFDLIPLFEQFIRESENGKRRKSNGEKIKKESVDNYRYTLRLLVAFCRDTNFKLRGCEIGKLNQREYFSEKNYWKKFYNNFTNYLYKEKDCHDNYVGTNIKVFRTFVNYIRKDKNLNIGEFYKEFYVRKEEKTILVLTPEQLKFLIYNKDFAEQLSSQQQIVKDMFVFGCSTGLRFSDLRQVSAKNIEKVNGEHYLKLRTQKTKTFTLIKLPEFSVQIVKKFKTYRVKQTIFPAISLDSFNAQLKLIGEKAGWMQRVEHTREKMGKILRVKNGKIEKTRFCDFMSSHMMRRTAITTMLILGMPEHLVKNVSGHTSSSSSFHRYVHYAQGFLDMELSKVHEQLENEM